MPAISIAFLSVTVRVWCLHLAMRDPPEPDYFYRTILHCGRVLEVRQTKIEDLRDV